ncbi:hypothetical protein OG244_28395 [Streptomyces brevispora]|uniref:hypothetical protein n=1 Tax=Streptomyces brevispora TaxID=887462 RepID=UPI002E36973A|nr:hypothetical protein [Streptomyces brevispora]
MTAITYVITHPGYRAVKLGYTGAESDRIEQLARHGWQSFRRLSLVSSRLAWEVEQAALFQIRHRLYIPPYLTSGQMPSGGWTETASLSLIDAREAWEIVLEEAAAAHLAAQLGRPKPRRRIPVPPRRTAGDTPKFAAVARVEAARTARSAQVGAQSKPLPKRRGARNRNAARELAVEQAVITVKNPSTEEQK